MNIQVHEFNQDDGDNVIIVDYDTLPADYKKVVDVALASPDLTTNCPTDVSYSYGNNITLLTPPCQVDKSIDLYVE